MVVLLLAACTRDVGECFDPNDLSQGGGAGGNAGGPIIPTGAGGDGNVPPKPLNDSGPLPPGCVTVGSYSASLFKFSTTIADDGKDAGGGYQEATANGVKFIDGRQDPSQSWTCNIWVGMPVRTEKLGTISAAQAAQIAADCLTDASSFTMHSKTAWVPGAFCKQLAVDMATFFSKVYNVKGSARAQ
jgi:hypothetical protein